MKEIKVMMSGTVIVGDKPTALQDAMDIIHQVRKNKAKVMEAVLSIERDLSAVIKYHFFADNFEKGSEFKSTILDSDWCNFAAKRKLISHINEQKGYFKGNDKQRLEQLLKKAMSYRNAFAHGDIQSDAKTAYLNYFEGKQIKKELNDQYWTELEKDLLDCFNLVKELQYRSGTFKRPENAETIE